MIRRLLPFIFLLLPLSLWGQIVFRGTVSNEQQQPIAHAIVKLQPKGKQTPVAYTYTNAKGVYELSFAPPSGKDFVLVFARLGYRSVERTVALQSGTHDATLEEAMQEFAAAVVKAPPVRKQGDTITYSVSSLAKKEDRNMEEVISRIPGVQIEDGRIKYNGESINRFYIEGVNLLGGNYGLATRNIRPSDVNSINVMENHQPFRVLEGISFSNQAALNLKMKKSSLMRPVGNLTVGAGAGDGMKWLSELYLMLIAGQRQGIVSVKGNNFGIDYKAETNDFFEMSASTGKVASTLFSDTPFGAANLPFSRYRKNISTYVSAHGISTFKGGKSLTVNATYTFEEADFRHTRQTEYYTQGAPIIVDDEVDNHLRKQTGDVKLKWENNAETFYFVDILRLKASSRRNAYALPSVAQRGLTNDFALTNHFQRIMRKGARLFTIDWLAGLDNTPFARMRAHDTAADTLMVYQKAAGLLAYTQAQTALKFLLGQNGRAGTLTVGLLSRLSYETFESEHPFPLQPIARNDNSLLIGTVKVAPSYEVKLWKMNWQLSLPLTYDYNYYKNRYLGTHRTEHRPYCSPLLEMQMSFGGACVLTMSTSLNSFTSGLSSLLVAPFYNDYRQAQVLGVGDITEYRGWNSYLNFSWNDFYRGRSLQFMANYSRTSSDVMTSSLIGMSGQELSGQVLANNVSHQWMGRSEVSTSIRPLNTVVRLAGSLTHHRSAVLRQSLPLSVRNSGVKLRLSTETRFFRGTMLLRLRGNWGRSFVNTGTLKHNLTESGGEGALHLFLGRWEVYANASLTSTELQPSQYASSFFLDGGVRLKLRRWEWELRGRNLTNVHEYVTRVYRLADTYTYRYSLRPLEFLLTAKMTF